MSVDKTHTHIICVGCGSEFDITKEEGVNAYNNHKCGA